MISQRGVKEAVQGSSHDCQMACSKALLRFDRKPRKTNTLICVMYGDLMMYIDVMYYPIKSALRHKRAHLFCLRSSQNAASLTFSRLVSYTKQS